MKKKYEALGTAAALALAGVQVSADESEANAADDAAAESAVVTAFDSAATLSTEELGQQRAAADLDLDIEEVVINSSSQGGVVQGNVAKDTHNGANMITEGAFIGASGVISTVQNSGNNVLIQNSTIVNVSIEP